MTTPIRLGGAALLLGLLACQAPRPEIETGATVVRAGALRALPKETVGLIVMEVGSLRSLTSFGRWMGEMAAAAEQEGPLRMLRAKLGEETLDRIDRLALAVAPQPGNTVGYAVLAEGRLDEARERAALGGQDLATVEPASEGRPEIALTVLKGGPLAFGPRPVIEAVRANSAQRGGGLDANAMMLGLLGSVRPTSHLWGAVDFRTMARLGRQAPEGRAAGGSFAGSPLVSALVAFAFQGKVGSAVEIDLMGRADGEAGAKNLAETTKGLIRIGQVGATPEQSGDWLALLNSITVEQKGADIVLHATIPEQMLLALAEKARAAAESMPAPAAAQASPAPVVSPRAPAAPPRATVSPKSAITPKPLPPSKVAEPVPGAAPPP